MCQLGDCNWTATCIIVSPESGDDIAVCSFHVPEGAETFPMNLSI